jgi:hypothetical protein
MFLRATMKRSKPRLKVFRAKNFSKRVVSRNSNPIRIFARVPKKSSTRFPNNGQTPL